MKAKIIEVRNSRNKFALLVENEEGQFIQAQYRSKRAVNEQIERWEADHELQEQNS